MMTLKLISAMEMQHATTTTGTTPVVAIKAILALMVTRETVKVSMQLQLSA